ncbi:Ankyrin-2 [Trapelia coarctata]|nr:Ankyrin-2 [Trapelia coarctata]
MDPIGATATLITLIATTRTLVRTTISLCKAIDGAPKALTQIAKQVALAQHSLEHVQKTCSGNQSCLPPELQAMLTAALLAVAELVEELERVCKLRRCQSSVQARLRWALLKKSEATEIMQMLQHAKTDLGHVVQLVHLHIYFSRSASTSNLGSAQQAISSTAETVTESGDGDISPRVTDIQGEDEHRSAEYQEDLQSLPLSTESKREEVRRTTGALYNLLRPDQYKTTYTLSLPLRLLDLSGRRALVIKLMAEIWQACLAGDEQFVRDLITSRRASPYDSLDRCICDDPHRSDECCWRFKSGDTVLIAAITSGNISLVRYLINMGADVNASGRDHKSCLHRAFEDGDLEIARLLVGRGASLDQTDAYGQTILHGLLASPKPPTCHILSPAEWTAQTGVSFLDFLATSGYEDFSALDSNNSPALNHFAWMGLPEVCSRLLRLGASAKMIGQTSKTCMGTLIHGATHGGSIAMVEIVLTENPGLNIDLVNYFGRTPLHDALRSNHVDVSLVEYLLDRGADVNLRDRYGRTALYYAVARSNQEHRRHPLLESLLARGGDVLPKDCLGNTLLHHAARFGNLTCMSILLEKACEVRAKNIYNNTPLHYAGLLLDLQRWDLDCTTREVLQKRISETVNLLLSRGMDPNISGYFIYDNLGPAGGACDNWYQINMHAQPSRVCITPASLANSCRDTRIGAIFRELLIQFSPEISTDEDGDLFWNSKEHLECAAYGSEYLVVAPEDSHIDETELLRRIWEDSGCQFYSENSKDPNGWLWDDPDSPHPRATSSSWLAEGSA